MPAGSTGFCRAGSLPYAALASLHQWEEPCISGSRGAGTVFFSNCNLRCCFCQNHRISQAGNGREVPLERLAAIFLEQAARGAHNLELVTPTHYVPQVLAALGIAKKRGFSLPVVYNSNAYETVETVSLLKNQIDIYLPDLKYYDDKYARRFSSAPNYFAHASRAISRMVELAGPPVFGPDGLMQKGVIVRHLVLPGLAEDSRRILAWLQETFGNRIYISLMNQYTPLHHAANQPELNRCLTSLEYKKLIAYAQDLGITNCFIQEGRTASSEFIPKFDCTGVMPPPPPASGERRIYASTKKPSAIPAISRSQ